MGKSQDLFSEENEIFGPGIDLFLSLLAILMVIIAIGASKPQENKDDSDYQFGLLKIK